MKYIFLGIVVFLMSNFSRAQIETEHALGLRLGGSNGLGYEISYQRAVDLQNRWQFDLGAKSNNDLNIFKFSTAYQWVHDLSALAIGFNWYYGAGAGIGAVDGSSASETFVNILANLGLEYNFDFPLQLSLGVRPEFGIVNGGNLSTDLALGVRYSFD